MATVAPAARPAGARVDRSGRAHYRRAMTKPYRLGIDIGGTFTDFALLDPRGRVQFGKVLTTPDDPLRGVLDGVRELLADERRARRPGRPRAARHHAHHQRGDRAHRRPDGAPDHRGVRGRARDRAREPLRPLRPRDADARAPRPAAAPPAGRRAHRPDGAVVRPVDTARLAEVLDRLREAGVEAVAICFLHSYQNPRPRASGRRARGRRAPRRHRDHSRPTSCPRSASSSAPRPRSSTPTSSRSRAATWGGSPRGWPAPA